MLFVDYIHEVESNNLYPKYVEKYISNTSQRVLFFYGPSGTGKYSQALYFLKKTTGSTLQYERKMIIELPKFDFMIKMSDVHYEIDMTLLLYSNKSLWNSIYKHIIGVNQNRKQSYIMLKHFDKITPEILDIFFFYIQDYRIKFICLTEHLSFIPNHILDSGYSISFYHRSLTRIKQIFKTSSLSREKLHRIQNLHDLKDKIEVDEYEIICSPILNSIYKMKSNIDIRQFRKQLYDILIFGLNVYDVLWYVLERLNITNDNDMLSIVQEMDVFGKYYHNNYRPIYHLEKIFLYIACVYHEIPTSSRVTRFS